MNPSPHVDVRIDLARVRINALDVKRRASVPVIAVVKADAYGHGIGQVTDVLRDLVDEFCVFALREAVDAQIYARTGKRTLVIGPPLGAMDRDVYIEQHARPAITTVEEALELAVTGPALCIDMGMQRFACPPGYAHKVLDTGLVREVFVHAKSSGEVTNLVKFTCGWPELRRHAAGSSLLGDPHARLDAVRPGRALYAGAARVTATLVEARDSWKNGDGIGYTQWKSATGRHGVIVAGYSNGLRQGPCIVNGIRRRIPEVGMQSAFVEIGPGDKAGDEVVLLGDELVAEEIASVWATSPQDVMVRLCGVGVRRYIGA